MSQEARRLVSTLKKIVHIKQFPFFPYNLYRYFTLLENLAKQKKLVDPIDSRSVFSADAFAHLSYTQIKERNWSVSRHTGSRQSRKKQQKIRFIDDEAREEAQSFINKQSWPNNTIKQMIFSFVDYNDDTLQLHIRDIPLIVCAIFLFLSLRNNPNKRNIIFQINSLINTQSKKLQKRAEEQEEEKEEQEIVPEYRGRDDKKGAFQIIKVTGTSETSGAKCMDKTIPQIKHILNEVGISNDEIANQLNLVEGEPQSEKYKLCKLLQDHLKSQERYT